MGCPDVCPCSGHVGIFELPIVQCLAIVTIVFIRVHGSLPKEVVKYFHDSGLFSTAKSQTTMRFEILDSTWIRLQFNSTLAKVYAFLTIGLQLVSLEWSAISWDLYVMC